MYIDYNINNYILKLKEIFDIIKLDYDQHELIKNLDKNYKLNPYKNHYSFIKTLLLYYHSFIIRNKNNLNLFTNDSIIKELYSLIFYIYKNDKENILNIIHNMKNNKKYYKNKFIKIIDDNTIKIFRKTFSIDNINIKDLTNYLTYHFIKCIDTMYKNNIFNKSYFKDKQVLIILLFKIICMFIKAEDLVIILYLQSKHYQNILNDQKDAFDKKMHKCYGCDPFDLI